LEGIEQSKRLLGSVPQLAEGDRSCRELAELSGITSELRPLGEECHDVVVYICFASLRDFGEDCVDPSNSVEGRNLE